MRVEWLFLQWSVVIGLIALAATYAQSWWQSRPKTEYDTIPAGRGVMVDCGPRNIYAVRGNERGC